VSFYVALGDGRFASTEHTAGPWCPDAQHGGPPAALLGGLLEAFAPRPELILARVAIEILGPVPVAELASTVAIERAGRSVELVAGELRAGGRAVLRARGWRVRRSPLAAGAASSPPALPTAATPTPAAYGSFPYGRAVEWRWADGDWDQPGPASVWTRLRMPLVEGAATTPLQRVLAVADSGNGVSSWFEWGSALYINPELTVHVLREAAGEWICLQARTEIAQGGAGLATSRLSDRTGPVARGAQALLVASTD